MYENLSNKALERLFCGENLCHEEWISLLTALDDEQKALVCSKAGEVARERFGRKIFVRALIEISSYCKNNCYYCGLRCSNRNAQRYRLSHEEILACCREGARLGFSTFVLQGGEDSRQNDEWVEGLVASIRREFPDKAITLSLGERSRDAYAAFRRAGADRYLLRHETRSDLHYSQLHPAAMSAQNRRESLWTLKELGYQTGSGMMIGSPYQTDEHLADDFLFLQELQPEMIGVGPFVPAKNTPLENFPAGSVDKTILVVSLLRLRFPDALLPATTALATLRSSGREQAILAGANVVMPNLSPGDVRAKYSIYDNKANSGAEAAEMLTMLEERLKAIDYRIDYGRGDFCAHINK